MKCTIRNGMQYGRNGELIIYMEDQTMLANRASIIPGNRGKCPKMTNAREFPGFKYQPAGEISK